jgi:hypothetical protein
LQIENTQSNGKSEAVKKMVEVKPYEDTETLKLEDVGHVEKQMRIK